MAFFTDRPTKPKFSSNADDEIDFGSGEQGFGFDGLDSVREEPIFQNVVSPISGTNRSNIADTTLLSERRPQQDIKDSSRDLKQKSSSQFLQSNRGSTSSPTAQQLRFQQQSRPHSGSASPVIRPVGSGSPNDRAPPFVQQRGAQFKPPSFSPSSNKFSAPTSVASTGPTPTKKSYPTPQSSPSSNGKHSSASSGSTSPATTDSGECSSTSGSSASSPMQAGHMFSSVSKERRPLEHTVVDRDESKSHRQQGTTRQPQPSFTPRTFTASSPASGAVVRSPAVIVKPPTERQPPPTPSTPLLRHQEVVKHAMLEPTSSPPHDRVHEPPAPHDRVHEPPEVEIETEPEEEDEEDVVVPFGDGMDYSGNGGGGSGTDETEGINNPMHTVSNVSCVTPTSSSRVEHLREYVRMSQETPGGRDIVRECDAINVKVDSLYAAMDGLRAMYSQMRGHAFTSRKKMAEASCKLLSEDPLHDAAPALLSLQAQMSSMRASFDALRENESGKF